MLSQLTARSGDPRYPRLPVIPPEVNGVLWVCFLGPVIPNLSFGGPGCLGVGDFGNDFHNQKCRV